MATQQHGTARTYAFIGFIFYALAVAAGVFGALIFAFIFLTAIPATSPFPTTPSPTIIGFPLVGFFSLIFIALLIPSIALTIFAWFTVKHIDAGRYEAARTNSLILGIIGIFFGMIIGGIFFLLTYVRLAETHRPPYPQPPPYTQRFCTNCGKPLSQDARHCPHCGKEQPT